MHTHAVLLRSDVCAAQGIVGETYNRMLAGSAVNDPKSQYFLPDDYTFHGKGSEEAYVVNGYFADTGNTLFGKVPLALSHELCSQEGYYVLIGLTTAQT